MEEFVGQTEFNQFKRLHAAQLQSMQIRLEQMEAVIKAFSPKVPLAPQTRDLLGKQVENMNNQIRFLQSEIINIRKEEDKNGGQKKD